MKSVLNSIKHILIISAAGRYYRNNKEVYIDTQNIFGFDKEVWFRHLIRKEILNGIK